MTTIDLIIERFTEADDDYRDFELTVEVRGTVTRYRPATLLDPAEGGAGGGAREGSQFT